MSRANNHHSPTQMHLMQGIIAKLVEQVGTLEKQVISLSKLNKQADIRLNLLGTQIERVRQRMEKMDSE
jgi:hypothetical protein